MYPPGHKNWKGYTEYDGLHKVAQRFYGGAAALIVMDAWEEHPNEGFGKRVRLNVEEKLVPLIKIARSKGILIIYAMHGVAQSKALSVEGKDVKSDYSDTAKFHEFLQAKGIKTLFYTGYASNLCLLFRPVGIVPMSGYDLYKIIVVRDCTLAYETPDSLQEQWCSYAAINIIETAFGESTTLEHFQGIEQ